MQDSRGVVTNLSDAASFTVASGSSEDKKRITVFYADPEKKYESLLLETWPPDTDIRKEPMTYDHEKKGWVIDIERSKDTGELFLIKANKDETVLQDGFISLKNGMQQPVNKVPGVPEGKLETFLLTKDGKIIKPDSLDEQKLEKGERFVKVYTPPGYDSKRVPPYDFQVTLDGGQYLFPMQMNVLFDNLIAAKQMEPVVTVFISPHSGPPEDKVEGFGIVMPKGYPLSMRLREYNCNYEFADTLAIMPHSLRGQFNVTDDPKHTTIWGVSAGGLQAIYTSLLHPDVFGNVVAESPQAWNIPEQHGKGKNWREGIVEKFDERGNCTWENGTAPLPPTEGRHNEHITQIMRSGQDPISGRKLDSSKPIVFYFDAGEREKEYHPKEGTANLVKATEVFAEAAMQRGHSVIDHTVHVLPNGGHHNMTWMRNLAHAARSIHSSTPTLAITSNAQLHQSLNIKSSSQRVVAQDKEKKITTTDDIASKTVKGQKSSKEFSADIKRTAVDDTAVNYSDKSPSFRKK